MNIYNNEPLQVEWFCFCQLLLEMFVKHKDRLFLPQGLQHCTVQLPVLPGSLSLYYTTYTSRQRKNSHIA